MTDDRQDRNGVRTPVDIERRHKLGLIEKTAKEVGEIKEIDANFSSTSTRALQNKIITTTINRLFNEKVDKVSGMTLSHNDYTDNDKYKVNNLDGHVHSNINILNSITSQDIDNWNATSFESYSTSEEVIGKWIDGKPIYRIVCVINSPIVGNVNYPHYISNFKTLISATANGTQVNGGQQYFPRAVPGDTNWSLNVGDVNSTTFSLQIANNNTGNYAFTKVNVILEYTKTTD